MDPYLFVLPPEQYKRDISPIEQAVNQTALYLHKQTGRPLETCLQYVTSAIKNNRFKTLRDPIVTHNLRQDNGDRIETTSKLSDYIKDSVREQEIIAPTLTTYINSDKEESIFTPFIGAGVKRRSTAKKLSQKAYNEGNMELYSFKDKEQLKAKTTNNAFSGAQVSTGTFLKNHTAHTTLTSTCRVTSGTANVNNEKLLSGNRHYYNYQVVINNITSIISLTDMDKFDRMMKKYNLHYPSTDEVMKCITYSTMLYWDNKALTQKIKEYVDKLDPVDKAAFVYIGDFYHIKEYNDSFMRGYITTLSEKVTEGEVDNILDKMKTLDPEYLVFTHQICEEEMMGKGKNYAAIEHTQELKTLYLTTKNVEKVLDYYKEFIQAILVTNIFPASMAYFPQSVRRAVLTSDTDSTIFTTQLWPYWFTGEHAFNKTTNAVRDVMVFTSAMNIVHLLAKLSTNLGVSKKYLNEISMKSEFVFKVFVPTQVGKHYFASQDSQEGNVFKVPKLEVKGVHLKTSNAPPDVMERANQFMTFIITSIKNGEKIKMNDVLKVVSDLELEIIESLLSGSRKFYRNMQIKDKDGYKKGEYQSPYIHYLFWEEVFAPKYGSMPPPPYIAMKIPTNAINRTSLKDWINSIEDKELATRLENWLNKLNKDRMPVIGLSLDIIDKLGIPKEIHGILDTRKTVLDICNIFYILLETLGFYKKPNRLISDDYRY
jgi:hypothetical protein